VPLDDLRMWVDYSLQDSTNATRRYMVVREVMIHCPFSPRADAVAIGLIPTYPALGELTPRGGTAHRHTWLRC